MPRLSALGAPLLSGIGDGVSGRWLNATESARQVCGPGGCRIVARVEPDGAERELDGEGANFLAAGFNVWATYLAGRGYKDSYGHTHPSWMPLEVDASRAVLVTDHDSGCGLWLVRPNGQADQIVGSDVMLDVQQGDIDNGVVIYRAGGQLRRWPDGAVFPVTLADPRISNRYLCGGGPGGLWFVPWDQPDRGLLLSPDGRDFNPDIGALPSGLVRVVSSRTAGEGPGDLRAYDINPVLGEWRDIREPLPVPAEPPAPVPTFAPVPHAMALAFVDEPGGYGLTGIKEDGTAWPIDAKTAGVLLTVDKDDAAKTDAAIALARTHHLPLIAYWDGPDYPVTRVPRPAGVRVIPELNGYPIAGETVPAFITRQDAALANMRRHFTDVAVYGALYCQWNDTAFALEESLVVACAGALWDLCITHRVRILTWFIEFRGDPTHPVDGIRRFPSFQTAKARMKAACSTADQWPLGAIDTTTPPLHPPKDDSMKARSIYLRSVADPSKFVGVTKAEHGGLLTVGQAKQAFVAYLFDNRWDENMHVELGINTDVKVMAPGDGGQLSLNDRYGSTLVIKKGVRPNSWGLVATGSPVSARVGRSDYHGDDVGQVRTMDPAYPINDWESVEAIDVTSGEVLGPF